MVRHGEVWNPDGIVYAALEGFGLSRRGRIQAAATAGRLASRPLGAVVTSPLLRARQTARVIAARHGLRLRRDSRLEEWRSAARWAGHRWHELHRIFPGELERYLQAPDTVDGIETMAEVAARVESAIASVADVAEAAFVTHQDPLQAARLTLTGRDLSELNFDKPAHAEVVTLQRKESWTEVARWAPPVQHPFPPRERAGEAPS